MKTILNKKKNIFVFLLIICFSNGCDLHQRWQYSILNNTNDTILFCFSEKYFLMEDTVIICNPYSDCFLVDISFDYIREHSCYPHPNLENETDLIITVITSSGRTLKKDIKKNANGYCAENSRHLGKVVFEINEEDLE